MSAVETIRDFLKECGVFFYATDEEGKPRIRPFGFNMVYNDKLYISMGAEKACFRQTMANPEISICCHKGGSWMRVQGRAVRDESPEAIEAAFTASPGLRTRYAEASANTIGLFYIDIDMAEKTSGNTVEKII